MPASRTRSYVPDRGDAVWLHFEPQAGHEQAGRRPAVVLSPRAYNEKVSLALVCPVTSQRKGYPFEVELPANLDIAGVVLSDQVRSLDWRARKADFICVVSPSVIQDVLRRIALLLNE